MAIVFFIILFLILGILLFILSTIRIDVQEFKFNNQKKENKCNYSFFIDLYFLDKIKIFSLMFNKEKVQKLNQKMDLQNKIKDVDFKKVKRDLPSKKEIKQLVEKLKIKLEEFHLILQIGTEDVIITSAIVTGIASILGIILAKLIKNYKKEKYRYEIIPVYKNMVNLSFDCIIKVKMIHIISIIYKLASIRKEKIKYERTSNRRSYDYSYEQY